MPDRPASVPHGVPSSEVRKCRVCGTPVAYFASTNRETRLVLLASWGRAWQGYVCKNHEKPTT